MARKNAKELRERNKPQSLVNREQKNKRSGKAPKDKRDIFAQKMMKQLEALKATD